MSTLYWTNASGNSEWENVLNWFSADPGGASNPNAAAQATSVPWTQNDGYIAYDLTLSSAESGAPIIDETNVGTTIGATDDSWSITGTCGIAGLTLKNNGLIYEGTFSGDGFLNEDSGIFGGIFSGNGFTNNATVGFATWTGDGFINNGGIANGTFTGAGFVNGTSGYINGGLFTGSGFTNEGNIYGGTFNPTGTIPLSAVVIGEEIVELKNQIRVTSIVVTHDRELAFGVADRIAIINEGRIVTIGTPDEVKRFDDPLVQKFLRADFKRETQTSNL